jgi:hypothetical protein
VLRGEQRHERNDTVASVQTVSSSILYVAEESMASAPPSDPPQEPLPTPPNSAAFTIKPDREWPDTHSWEDIRADRGVTPCDWDDLGERTSSARDTSSSLASEATELLSSLLDSFGEASPARDDVYLRPHWHDGDSARRSSTTGESILSYTSTLSSGASDGADLQSLIDGLMDESDDDDDNERGSASSGFTWPPRPSHADSSLAPVPTPSIRLSPADGSDSLDVDDAAVAFDMVSTPGTPSGVQESPCPPSRVRMGGGRAVRPRVSDLDLTKRVNGASAAAPSTTSAALPPSVVPPSMPRHVDLRVGFAHVPPPSFSPELLHELGLGPTAPDTPCATPTHKRMPSAPLDLAAMLDEYTPPQSVSTSAKHGKSMAAHTRTSSEPCVFRDTPAIIVRPSDSDVESECGSVSGASHGSPSCASYRDSMTSSRRSMASGRNSMASCGSASLLSCGDSPGVIATARVVASRISAAPAPASLLHGREVHAGRFSQGVQCATQAPVIEPPGSPPSEASSVHRVSPPSVHFAPAPSQCASPPSLSFASATGESFASPPSAAPLHYASPVSSPASSTRRDSFWSTGEGHNTSMSSVWSPDDARRQSGTYTGKLLPVAEIPEARIGTCEDMHEDPLDEALEKRRASIGSLSVDEAEALEQQLRFEEQALTAVLHSRQTWTGGSLCEYLLSGERPARH